MAIDITVDHEEMLGKPVFLVMLRDYEEGLSGDFCVEIRQYLTDLELIEEVTRCAADGLDKMYRYDEGGLFYQFKAGMYQAAQMLDAPNHVLVLLASAVTRSELLGRFQAWMDTL